MPTHHAKVKAIKETVTLKHADMRVPAWAIKTTFLNDDERTRFEASVREGYTPLHVAECEEERGVYEIVDGVHRYEILRQLGEDHVCCYTHGVLPVAARKALAVRYAWTFPRDHAAFAAALKELQDFDATLLDWSPLDANETQRLVAELNSDLDLFDHADGEDEETYTPRKAHVREAQRALRIVTCPHCAKEFNL